ncbi:hypothetical protein [Leisingera sp. ANG-Vp]|uniref:hypothetical protein n=1 Tax=Leisingera sp. ANG-Vp TaxID=1577896 RepID=UPI000A6331DA|nr:hypothetical protein [Leisingera sp. ANG-Vp]
MKTRVLRTVAICAILSTLLGCSGAGVYPFSGQPASESDPVMRMNMSADYMLMPGL